MSTKETNVILWTWSSQFWRCQDFLKAPAVATFTSSNPSICHSKTKSGPKALHEIDRGWHKNPMWNVDVKNVQKSISIPNCH